MARICLLLPVALLCTAGTVQAQVFAGPGPTTWVSQGAPATPVPGPAPHKVPYHAPPQVVAQPVAASCQSCATHGYGCRHRHLDLRRLWEWLTYCPLRSGHACSGKTCEPMCRPGLYEYFLPCAGGHPPRLPGCASCAGCAKHH